jgi:hypothetical protein
MAHDCYWVSLANVLLFVQGTYSSGNEFSTETGRHNFLELKIRYIESQHKNDIGQTSFSKIIFSIQKNNNIWKTDRQSGK